MSSTPAALRTLAVAALGTFLSLMVFTAPLATINATATSLDAGIPGRTWVLSSMSVGLASALLVAGAIADDVGRRRTFVVGMAVLAAGSLLAAVAPHVLLFVVARIIEGIGAAAVIAASLGLIAHAFAPGPERAAASGVWGASLGAGIAAGPLLTAGLDRYADWRLAYVVFAACAVVLGAAALLVEESRSRTARRGPSGCGAARLGHQRVPGRPGRGPAGLGESRGGAAPRPGHGAAGRVRGRPGAQCIGDARPRAAAAPAVRGGHRGGLRDRRRLDRPVLVPAGLRRHRAGHVRLRCRLAAAGLVGHQRRLRPAGPPHPAPGARSGTARDRPDRRGGRTARPGRGGHRVDLATLRPGARGRRRRQRCAQRGTGS